VGTPNSKHYFNASKGFRGFFLIPVKSAENRKMEISPRTVEAIKDRLMERFGSKNTAGLVFFAVKNNLVD
jgi:hypothetical protein